MRTQTQRAARIAALEMIHKGGYSGLEQEPLELMFYRGCEYGRMNPLDQNPEPTPLEDRVAQLESMLKTVTETVVSLTNIVNTGSYEYDIGAVSRAIEKVQKFENRR